MNCVLVNKTGELENTKIKDNKIETLHKKCSFKSDKDFEERSLWKVKVEEKKYKVYLYAKSSGKANTENKYEFPPPVASELYFGNCILINKDEDDNLCDLSIIEWCKIHEKLYGGFEDLSNTAIEDENEKDELDDVPDEMKTKDGYLKDGFVVDGSDDESMNSYDSELSEDQYEFSDEDD